jgi:hypothetical protein
MIKEDIAQLLVEEHNSYVYQSAYVLFMYDYQGDMELRHKTYRMYITKTVTVKEIAKLLVGSEIWDDLIDQRITVTDTYWWRNRKFNYGGQPTESRLVA